MNLLNCFFREEGLVLFSQDVAAKPEKCKKIVIKPSF